MTTYQTRLAPLGLDATEPIYRLTPEPPARVRARDPAVLVMTDLRRVPMVTVAPDASIELAHALMMHARVRLLGVVDGEDRLLGLVSARDVMGEKPLTVATRERIPRQRIRVDQVMTPRAQIEPLLLRDVERASVRDVVLALRTAGRQHALVVEPREQGGWHARGIFSATQIGRQLGVDVSPDGRVQSFAEFESLLGENESEVAGYQKLAQ